MSEAFGAAGISIDDSGFAISCGSCALLQSLADGELREAGERTEYVCARSGCDAVVLMVGPSSALPGGFQLGHNAYLPMGEGLYMRGGKRPDATR
jgi:hypothetical protein